MLLQLNSSLVLLQRFHYRLKTFELAKEIFVKEHDFLYNDCILDETKHGI